MAEQRTLKDEQIRVSEHVKDAEEVLRGAKPYFDEAAKMLADPGRSDDDLIEVPPKVFRDLVVMANAEMKKAKAWGGAVHDRGDSDWNPFNRIDFEFD